MDAMEILAIARRKASKSGQWHYAEEAAQAAGVKVYPEPDAPQWPDLERLEADIRAKMERPLIVTRHAATVGWLRARGIEGEVMTHVKSPEQVRGRVVYGNLPMRLAAEAAYICAVEIDIPAEMRGKELDIDALNKYVKIAKYRVTRLGD